MLQSLGVPQEAARDVLDRTGTLRDALDALGISHPEGMVTTEGGGIGDNRGQRSPGRGSRGGSAVEGKEDGAGSEEDAEGEDSGDSDGEKEEGGDAPTEEEMRLYDELAADRSNQDEEGYLDVTLDDEADAADM